MKEPKLCIDCRHCELYPNVDPEVSADLARCLASPALTSFVDGKQREDKRFCDNERQPHGGCGPEARRFEPKPNT